MQISDFGDYDALLAVATGDRAYAFLVPTGVRQRSPRSSALQRNEIEPALRQRRLGGCGRRRGATVWTTAGLDSRRVRASRWYRAAGALVDRRPGRRWRCGCGRGGGAASGAKPSSPRPSGSTPPTPTRWPPCRSTRSTTCPSRSSSTSTTRCAPATTNWPWRSRNSAPQQTEPFSRAVDNAKTTLAQAFNVRQILDDAVPETPQQRRDLLTRVVVAAAQGRPGTGRATGGLREAARPGDQRAVPAGRADPADGRPHRAHRPVRAGAGRAAQPIRRCRTDFGRRQRRRPPSSGWLSPIRTSPARATLVARPVAASRWALVDAIRAAESSLGQARSLLDAVDSAGVDINRAVAALPPLIADIQNGINQADGQLQQGKTTAPA